MPLKYVGRYPDSDGIITPAGYVDARWNAVKVDNAFIDANVAPVVATLSTQSYVDTRDATRAKKTYVDTQDALYVPTSQRAAASGVAPLNASVQVPAGNVPSGILTERSVTALGAPTVLITGNQTCTSAANTKEYLAATIAVADPGYPYLPQITGQVMGFANNGADPGNGLGVGVYGQAIVFDTANNVWARLVTAGNFRLAAFPLWPWAVGGATPAPITGATTLSLYFSLYSTPGGGAGYVFTPTGLVFGGTIFPGL